MFKKFLVSLCIGSFMLSGQIYAAENEDLQFSADADVYEDVAFDFEDKTAARLLAGDNAEIMGSDPFYIPVH